jgi:hypothetical protein
MKQHQQLTGQRSANRPSMILALIGMGIVGLPFLAKNVANGSLALSAATRSTKRGVETQIKDLHPFTHIASIPASSDPSKIKLEKVKATRVFTKEKSILDPGYCKDLPFRDPGGSMYCPYTEDAAPAPAYEVTYSFKGQPLASEEYGNRYFTFQVYFRPEELPPGLRRALTIGKMKRRELATYFRVATSRLPVRAAVIDEASSSFCDGNYIDGNWIQKDPNCKDKVSFKIVTRPSDSITVEVDPVSPRPQQAAAPTWEDHSSVLSASDNRR